MLPGSPGTSCPPARIACSCRPGSGCLWILFVCSKSPLRLDFKGFQQKQLNQLPSKPIKNNKTGCICAGSLIIELLQLARIAAGAACICPRCGLCAPPARPAAVPLVFLPLRPQNPCSCPFCPSAGACCCSGCRCWFRIACSCPRLPLPDRARYQLQRVPAARPPGSPAAARPGTCKKESPCSGLFCRFPVHCPPGTSCAGCRFRIACSCPPGSPGTSCPPGSLPVPAAAGKTRTIPAHGVHKCSAFRPFCSCFFRRCRADRVRPGKNNPNNNEFSPAAGTSCSGCRFLVPDRLQLPPWFTWYQLPPVRIAPGAWFTCKKESPLQLRRFPG